MVLKKWSFAFDRASFTITGVFLLLVQSWFVKWESRVHSTIFPMFYACSTSKCWWRFCCLKLSIWEQKSSCTAVVAKVHLTCPMSGFDLLQIQKCVRAGQWLYAVVCSASFYSFSSCDFSVPKAITLFLMTLHKISA